MHEEKLVVSARHFSEREIEIVAARPTGDQLIARKNNQDVLYIVSGDYKQNGVVVSFVTRNNWPSVAHGVAALLLALAYCSYWWRNKLSTA